MNVAERDDIRRADLTRIREQRQARRRQAISLGVGTFVVLMGLKLAPLILFVPAAVKMTAAAESGGLSFPGVAIAAYVAGGKAPPGGIPYTVEDQSGDGQHRVVRFRKADGGDLIAELYLPPKQRGTVRLRAGSYQVNIAQGRRWHGPDVHFGRAGHVYDYGQHEIGGNVAGFNIGPASVTGTAHEIPDSRF